MKLFLATIAFALVGFFSAARSAAADAPAPADAPPASADKPTDPVAAKEVQALVKKINAKLQQGQDKETDFTAELKQFDDLKARYKTNAPTAAAEAAFMEAMLYVQVFENPEKAADLMRTVQKDFPNTRFAKDAGEIVASVERQSKAKKVAESLVVGSPFPEFTEQDVNGKPLSLAMYKGKVVLIDFWATWCPPCRAELPNVIAAYEKYHGKGFDVVGISLDDDKTKLVDFTKSNKMPWPQYFDGKGWGNKLAQTYGITAIPATFLVDGDGKIIGKGLRGEELGATLAKVLEKK